MGLRYEGAAGFYKGLKPSLLRVVPATGITLVIYEHLQHFLIDIRKEREKKKRETESHDD